MRSALLGLLLVPLFVFSNHPSPGVQIADNTIQPWLTGPLIAATATNVDPGHPSLLLSFTFLNTYGNYDSNWKLKNDEDLWNLSLASDLQLSFSERTGVELIVSATTSFTDGSSDTNLNDTILFLGYQMSDDIKDSPIPDCRFTIQVIFPSGRHDRLRSPLQRAIAITGQGAYFIGPGFACQKLFYLPKNRFLMLYWAVDYSFPTKAKVRGFNAYGGGIGTKGVIRPGQLLTGNLSFEYSWARNWAFAMDLFIIFQQGTSRFEGRRGVTEEGDVAEVGLPSSTQMSITPSIEYNVRSDLGWIFGAWVSIAGRNDSAFAGGFLGFSYTF